MGAGSQAGGKPHRAARPAREKRHRREGSVKRLAKPKPAPLGRLPIAQSPRLSHAVLGARTGESSRSCLHRGPVYQPSTLPHSRPKPQPEDTARGGAQETHRAWGNTAGGSRAPRQEGGRSGSLTERTLMRIGVSNRHAILSLPTRLLPAPARGPALSTANYWANGRSLCRKSGR